MVDPGLLLLFVILSATVSVICILVIESTLKRFRAESLTRLWKINAKLDRLAKETGVAFEDYRGVRPDVVEALERGNTVLAAQRYMEATGVGLMEAKKHVDEVRRLIGLR